MNELQKFFLVAPITLIILILYIRSTGFVRNYSNESLISPDSVSISSESQNFEAPSVENSKGMNFDLDGPSICQYDSKEASVSAFIKDKHIYANIKTNGKSQEIIVDDDCGYIWVTNKIEGQKICGIGTYIGLYEQFSSLISSEMISGLLSERSGIAKDLPVDLIGNISKSCVDGAVGDDAFTVPKDIIFKEVKMSDLNISE